MGNRITLALTTLKCTIQKLKRKQERGAEMTAETVQPANFHEEHAEAVNGETVGTEQARTEAQVETREEVRAALRGSQTSLKEGGATVPD